MDPRYQDRISQFHRTKFLFHPYPRLVYGANGLFLDTLLDWGRMDIILGEDNPEDDILLQLDLHLPLYHGLYTTDISYPLKGFKSGVIITYLEMRNKVVAGTGGTVEIVRGGVGFDHVAIRIIPDIVSEIHSRILLKGTKKFKPVLLAGKYLMTVTIAPSTTGIVSFYPHSWRFGRV